MAEYEYLLDQMDNDELIEFKGALCALICASSIGEVDFAFGSMNLRETIHFLMSILVLMELGAHQEALQQLNSIRNNGA